MSIEMKFIDAIQSSGITPPESVYSDGEFHRFSTNGKSDDKSGWYILYDDEVAAGSFGDWRSGLTQNWCVDRDRKMTASEQQARYAKINAMKLKHEDEKVKSNAAAMQVANELWAKSKLVQSHEYLHSKGVIAHGIKQLDDALVIPLAADGVIHSLQFINADGKKKFLFGGRIKGCYFIFGIPSDIIYICEGYATGASIYEATSESVVVAFNAGNLTEVAIAIRKKHPTIRLVICADDDKNDTGVNQANKASELVGASVVKPNFGNCRTEKMTDFNDLHKLNGLEVVKMQLAHVAFAEPINANFINNSVDHASTNATKLNSEGSWLPPNDLLQESTLSPYPLDSLPSGLGDAVREVLDFVKCPVALAACSALSVLSVSAQHLANVRRAEGLAGPASLYMLAIAESGERKSSVDKHFTKAITAWEANQVESAKPEAKKFKVEHDSWSMQYEGLKQKIKETAKEQKPTGNLTKDLQYLEDDEPIAVRVPRLIYGDATPEQLGYALAKNWPSAGVLSSEAGIVFGSHGMSGDSAMRNMALINILWDGGTHVIDRRTTDSYRIQDARLTMGLAVQADTVRNFFENSKGLARGTGFLARFLVAWPTSTQGTRLFKEAPTAWPKLTVFSERITQLLNKLPELNEAGGICPITLDFSKEAKEAWIDFHNAVESELKLGGDFVDAKDVASKAADNVARLAGLFHLYETQNEGLINKDLVDRAIIIVTWHLYEAKRFLNQIAIPIHISNAIKVDDYILRYCSDCRADKVAKNYLRQHGAIRDKKLLNDALDELIDANRIRIGLVGRTSIIEVNPALLGGNYA